MGLHPTECPKRFQVLYDKSALYRLAVAAKNIAMQHKANKNAGF
jgi:hypothetical protein